MFTGENKYSTRFRELSMCFFFICFCLFKLLARSECIVDESGFWALIQRNIKGRSGIRHFERVENLVSAGMPDVNYCIRLPNGLGAEGWIELKYLKAWPKRPTTVVKIKHFTAEQRNWLLKRAYSGGTVWVFIRVENDFLLFDGITAARLVGKELTKEGMMQEAVIVWSPRVGWEQLLMILAG